MKVERRYTRSLIVSLLFLVTAIFMLAGGRVKRAAFGFRSWANFRIRALLYAGRPNWTLLSTITPR